MLEKPVNNAAKNTSDFNMELIRNELKRVGEIDTAYRARISILKSPTQLMYSKKSPQEKLLILRMYNKKYYDYLFYQLEGYVKKDALRKSMEDNKLLTENKEITTKNAYSLESTKAFREFSSAFYSVMAESGYSKCDPKNIAKYYKRLDEIATCDYVEPRDQLAAIRTLLQYNEVDTKQMQQMKKDEKESESMDEIKSLVSNLKKQFGKEKQTVIDVESV